MPQEQDVFRTDGFDSVELAIILGNVIVQRFNASFDISEFGGIDHHLTLVQDLEKKSLVTALNLDVEKEKDYPDIVVPPHHRLVRMTVRLTMFGKWFTQSCIRNPGRSS